MKDQIKEVEELREEHNELYNEITRWPTVVIVMMWSNSDHCGYHRYQTKVLVTSALALAMCGQEHWPRFISNLHLPISVWFSCNWNDSDRCFDNEDWGVTMPPKEKKQWRNICRCFGNEKCLAEFELLDMSPGSKLHGLGNLLCKHKWFRIWIWIFWK